MPYKDQSSLDELVHYGTPRHSGRYPWGSGNNPYQRTRDLLGRVEELQKRGLSEKEIAAELGTTTTKLRTQLAYAKHERRMLDVDRAKSLKADGNSNAEIARIMGYPGESSIRSLLNEHSEAKMMQARKTADMLKAAVDEKGMIDVGIGVERQLGISRERLKEAIYILEMEGYQNFKGRMPQVTNSAQKTTLNALCTPETEHREIFDHPEKIQSIKDQVISYDGGDSFHKPFEYPASMDSSRLKIKYAEEGGIDKDGVIELRRNVDDLSLGESRYAQVRILVDGTHYLKGMAVYSDNMPDGVDVLFNTNKRTGTPMTDVLKKINSDDPDNPFGSLIKEHGGQSFYDDPNGKYTDPVTGKKQSLSLINKRAEEGDWGEWANKLPSQFLGKQRMELIKKQLGLAKADKEAEFDEICSLTNPTIKKKLLESFSSDCDAAAVHLKAAALPRQRYQVILPLTSIDENEVYAPNYRNGEQVALIRYPHGGTFEIPILKVNNKQDEGRRILGNNPVDAIGIHSKVAERLSGADFDGDTVMVVPTGGRIKITSTPKLRGLDGFDPKLEYGTIKKGNSYYDSDGNKVRIMSDTQKQMGVISNLITDMTLKGATESELARAVRHSMVVIDAEKHKLDYKRSEEANQIAELHRRYQGHVGADGRYHEGAATLLSSAKSEVSVPKRKGSPHIDPKTGEQYWNLDEDRFYTVPKTDKRTGKTTTVQKERTQRSTKMAEAKDAYSLVSEADTPQERAYADYANAMKSLANRARKEMKSTPNLERSSSATETYQTEVNSLLSRLNIALMNAPRERKAQAIANSEIKKKISQDPDLEKDKKLLKKVSQQSLTNARNQVGAKRNLIEISDKEWEAIQAGAISENVLTKILNNADIDKLRQRAMPRSTTKLSQAKINLISARAASGYTNEEIAESLGVSPSVVSDYLKGKR